MKRILFVDDEPRVLDGLRDLLRKYRREMDMVFAGSGQDALEELRKRPFDVVVSDMRMPGMDGADLLQTVKQEFPDVVRIILSGHAEKNAIFRALPVSHQFLGKPCDPDTLRSVIERSCKLKSILADESIRKHVGSIEQLASPPKIYQEMMAAMQSPEVSTYEIAQIVEQDSAMSAKILQLVNSACFGSTKSIYRIDHAIMFLGLELVKNLVLTAHVFSSTEGRKPTLSFEVIQRHAIQTARLSRRILANEQKAQEAFAAGLLHDIGRIALDICIPDRYGSVVEQAHVSKRPLHEVEIESLEVSHSSVGAYLLGLWGLPFPIVEAVAYHHDPAVFHDSPDGVAFATAVANLIVDTLSGEAEPAEIALMEQLSASADVRHWIEIAERDFAG